MSSTQNKNRSVTSFSYIFSQIVWPRRWLLLLGLLLVGINRGASLVLPWGSKILLDQVIPQRDFDLLKWLIIGVAIAIFIQSLTSFLLTRLLSVEAQHLIAQLRSQVQQHIIQLPISFFTRQKSGALVSRVMTDVEGVRNLVGTGLVQLFGGIITAIAAFIILINIDAELTLYTLIPMVLFGLVTLRAFNIIRPIFKKRGEIQAEVTGRLTESMGGIKIIKGFHAEKEESRIFAEGVENLFRNIRSSLTATSLVTSSATLLIGLTTAAIMTLGGIKIMNDVLTTGDLLSFLLYIALMLAPIVQMGNIGSQLTEAFAGLERTEELLNQAREQDDPQRTVALAEVVGHLKFEYVNYEYEVGKKVLHDISFEAEPGTVTALVGTSGSGKTTIASLAATYLTPTEGQVFIDGQDLSKVQLATYRIHLGVVLQDDFLFEGTMRENILFARPEATESQLSEAVAAAYVSEFSDRFEKGLDTLVGERGVKLSGGQRQRIAIARAILADPRILILDEATSNLDAESESFIQQSLAGLMKGRTTIVIAHRLSTIRQADQILVIENGRITERGNHSALIAQQGRYFDLYTYQARI